MPDLGTFSNFAIAIKDFFIQKISPLLIAIITSLFGLGPDILKRMILTILVLIVVYRIARNWFPGFISFLVGLVIGLLGIRVLPVQFINLIMMGVIPLAIIFGIVMLVFKIGWKLRRLALALLVILFLTLWWFFGKEINYLIVGIIFLTFLLLDMPLSRMIAKLAGKAMKKSELKGQIAKLQKERQALAEKGSGYESDFANLSKKIEGLQRQLDKI